MSRMLIGAAVALESLPAWSAVEGRDAIRRSFRFRDFSAAFGFMTRGAMAAEAMNHHPEWTNIYNRVDVLLTTHDAAGVTDLDLALAQRMDALAAEWVRCT